MLRKRSMLALITLAVMSPVGASVAAAPDGPRLAAVRLTGHPATAAIVTMGPTGDQSRRVVGADAMTALGSLSLPRWSPDGSQFAFAHRDARGRRMISIVPAGGGRRPHAVPGTRGGMTPVFSPDGRSLAYARILRRGLHRYRWGSVYHYESTAVWIVDLETGDRRQLTKWRNGLEQFPSSFSPDGTTLLVMRSDVERSQDLETVALRFDGRTSSLLIGEGWFPVYSPDGSEIALFRQSGRNEDPPTDLFIVDADGSHLRQLTRTPRDFELLASWDPSGERIAYSKFQGYAFDSGSQGSIMEINSDGTCQTKILSKPGASFVGPDWQPGPGREAGRIAC